MDSAKSTFIQMILEANVLKWGSFTLKSGRVSPYFFNAGLFYSGVLIKQLGKYYADVLCNQNEVSVSHLFGPAYKGLPLATSAAIALCDQGIDVSLSFNRKEAKAHGEGGVVMGAPLKGADIVMVDDVITAGTAFRETKALIEAEGGRLKAVVIALDREERGPTGLSAINEIRKEGISVFSIITLSDLICYLEHEAFESQLRSLVEYRKMYGI